jgi:flagella basal body P-ring formation protein FlgA
VREIHVMTRALAWILVMAGTAAAAAPGVVAPEEAIAAAVAERLGVPAVVVVGALATTVEAEAGLVADADPAARLGRPSRFVLRVGRVRRGLAVATVTVTAAYPKAARSLARDEAIGPDAVDFSEGKLPAMPIQPLLGAAALIGLEARRDIVAGEPLTPAVLRVPPVVRSGDEVMVTVRIGAVVVRGEGIASGSGRVGDSIRVRQPQRPQVLTGRITGPGTVEIVP